MAQDKIEIDVKIKSTWVKPAAIFCCRHIKRRWVLRLLRNFTIARVYVDGKYTYNITLGDYLDNF